MERELNAEIRWFENESDKIWSDLSEFSSKDPEKARRKRQISRSFFTSIAQKDYKGYPAQRIVLGAPTLGEPTPLPMVSIDSRTNEEMETNNAEVYIGDSLEAKFEKENEDGFVTDHLTNGSQKIKSDVETVESGEGDEATAILNRLPVRTESHAQFQRNGYEFNPPPPLIHRRPAAAERRPFHSTTTASPTTKRATAKPRKMQCPCSTMENKCPAGPPGSPGLRGENGSDGDLGTPGKNGLDAEDIVVQSAQFDRCVTCPSGSPGRPGLLGKKGFRGIRGARGTTGIPGRNGNPGIPGVAGPEGLPGGEGDQGTHGHPGIDGTAGVGRKGDKGPLGDIGAPGDRGDSGQNGVIGEMGLEGSLGDQGMPGEEGQRGAPGEVGEEGEPGRDADYCPCPRRIIPRNEILRQLV